MPITVVIGNISATAGTNISLKGKIPAPIEKIVDAKILQGHSVNEGGTATYDIFTVVNVTATLVDEYTITLDADITTKDALQITYIPKNEKPNVTTVVANVFDPFIE